MAITYNIAGPQTFFRGVVWSTTLFLNLMKILTPLPHRQRPQLPQREEPCPDQHCQLDVASQHRFDYQGKELPVLYRMKDLLLKR